MSNSNNLFLRVALCLALLVTIIGSVAAQSGNASLGGTVTDPQGAVIPGATVTAENTKTGIVTTTTSNSNGIYQFASLQPGQYRTTVTANGFQKFASSEMPLELGAQIKLDIALTIKVGENSVTVSASTDSALSQTTSTVGAVITAQRIKDLPLASTNALDLVNTQAGVVGGNLAGGRVQGTNLSRDGVNANNQRFDGITAALPLYTSIDLIDEVRVVTSPADAELGRGSSQVQISTRSGGNEFHGSLYEANRNTALTANTFFNNLAGIKRNQLNRNQFGARLGGPLFLPKFGEGGPALYNGKNKTFFFFLYEGQRQRQATTANRAVLTAQARQGSFRFYPGVTNGNAIAAVPTVDATGNPVQPTTATGTLQTVNLFGRDPNRLVADPSGLIAKVLGATPLPNNYRAGDGLNTAGYEWSVPQSTDRDQINGRIDHYFSPTNHLSYSFSHQKDVNLTGTAIYPGGPTATSPQDTWYSSFGLTSSITPTLLNDVRIGFTRSNGLVGGNYESASALPLQLRAGGANLITIPNTFTNPYTTGNNSAKNINKFFTYGDTLTWVHGTHIFKGGVDYRVTGSDSYNSAPVVQPNVTLGAGSVAVQNIGGATGITGIGGNQTLAQNILTDLTGSIASVTQGFNLTSGADTAFMRGIYNARDFHQKESSFFVKDDWKIRPSLTLNLGVRYEYYGVPYEGKGRLTGVANSIFGLSGTSYTDLFKTSGTSGALTQQIPVGPNSPNPSKQLYNNDYNNFGPAVGLSWSLPFWGKDKTVVRLGYSLNYERIVSFFALSDIAASQAGGTTTTTLSPTTFVGLSTIGSVLPLTTTATPYSIVPLTDRTQQVKAFQQAAKTPEIQSFSFSIQRQLTSKITFEARYVGTRGTHLLRGLNLNEVNIFENGILNAFKITQAGGDSALLAQIFNGLTVNAGTNAALGQGVVGSATGPTASTALRQNSSTRAFFANNNVGAFAAYLNSTNQFTGANGGLLRRASLVENYIVANPQFTANNGAFSGGAAYYQTSARSSYDALQLELNKRFSGGNSLLVNYTWSKTLGEIDGADFAFNQYRSLRNWALDKQRLSYDRTHSFKTSGTAELPFGPGKLFLKSTNPVLSRIVGDWQFGGIFNIASGQPFSITSSTTSYNQLTGTAAATGVVTNKLGVVTRVANGIGFFNGYTQANDPAVANLTTLQTLSTASTLKAIKDDSGNIIFVNPLPGTLGIQPNFLTGPKQFNVDINLVKGIKIKESMNFEFRVDALNLTNTPMFGLPTADINNANFGRITTHAANAGNRVIVLNGRFNF